MIFLQRGVIIKIRCYRCYVNVIEVLYGCLFSLSYSGLNIWHFATFNLGEPDLVPLADDAVHTAYSFRGGIKKSGGRGDM